MWTRKNRAGALLAASAALLVPAVALAWAQDSPFGARVHKHEFSRVTVENDGCSLKARLFFDAPAEAYENDDHSRNYYRFHARLKFDGHEVLTRYFHNDAPGARVYNYVADTTNQGCWAKTQTAMRSLNVEGCRGRGCRPEDFK